MSSEHETCASHPGGKFSWKASQQPNCQGSQSMWSARSSSHTASLQPLSVVGKHTSAAPPRGTHQTQDSASRSPPLRLLLLFAFSPDFFFPRSQNHSPLREDLIGVSPFTMKQHGVFHPAHWRRSYNLAFRLGPSWEWIWGLIVMEPEYRV